MKIAKISWSGRCRLAAVLLSCGITSCSTKNLRSGATPADTVSLQIQLHAPESEEGFRLTKVNAPLKVGDQYALLIRSDVQAYLYVEKGQAGQAVFPGPGQGEGLLLAGHPMHVPSAGEWFAVPETPASQPLRVLAARKPLDEAERRRQLDTNQTRCVLQEGVYVIAREAEPPTSGNTGRGEKPADRLVACMDDHGVAVLRFEVSHE